MRKVRVKICGITSKQDLTQTIDAGADAVGFIVDVPSSPRNLSLTEAEKLAKLVPVFIDSIAVTVPRDLDSLKKIYERVKPNGLQIHGDKVPNAHTIREHMPQIRLIKALQSKPHDVTNASLEASKSFDAVLLDSYIKGKYGGTGLTHDWESSKIIRDRLNPIPLILAGGLTPDNVREAIRVVQPYAVDVSSGVEFSPRNKDPQKIVKFIENAQTVRL